MKARQIHPKMIAWRESAAFDAIRRPVALRNLRMINSAPKCGATCRTSGLPCRNAGLGRGGRCHLHGGASQHGRDWGLPRWPKKTDKNWQAKFDRKLKRLQKAEAERKRRVAAMSPEEAKRYRAWRQSHKAGPASGRLREHKFVASRPRPIDPEIMELERLIAKLKSERRAMEAARAVEMQIGVFA